MKITSLKTLGAAGLALYTVGTSMFYGSIAKDLAIEDEFSEEFEKNQKLKKAATCTIWAGDILMIASVAVAKKSGLIKNVNIIDVLKLKK